MRPRTFYTLSAGLALATGVILVVAQRSGALRRPLQISSAGRGDVAAARQPTDLANAKRTGRPSATVVGPSTSLAPPNADRATSPVTASRSAVWSPPVRVNLTPKPQRSVSLAIDGAYELRATGSSGVLARGDRLAEVDVTRTKDGFRLGKTSLAATGLEIHPLSSPSVWVNDHQYRGDVRLHARPDGTLIAVNVVPMEQYVAAVVDGEMPATFPAEARKTQAVLARTYAHFRLREAAGHPEFDLYATTRSQKYLGFQYRADDGRRLAGESESSRAAARETAGVVCHADGDLFSTYYCAVCGGATIDGGRVFADAAPVIRGVPCGYCDAAERNRWTTRLAKPAASETLRSQFRTRGESFGTLRSLRRTAGDDLGPAHPFVASDGRHERAISAVELRRVLPQGTLHSPFFDVREEGDQLIFTGRGHGHGVGVCQWGARGMALQRRDCWQILKHYYPGVTFAVAKPPSR